MDETGLAIKIHRTSEVQINSELFIGCKGNEKGYIQFW